MSATRLARALGRTYVLHIDGAVFPIRVRVSAIDGRSVTFTAVDAGVRLINNVVSIEEFFALDLEEAS